MKQLAGLKPERVFCYFKEIASIPHGSGNMKGISDYCLNFAKEHKLTAEQDAAGNVIIYKSGTNGYHDHPPVILQGHLDMVCQKTEDSTIDFEKDGLQLYVDGDFLKASGTTLGADNGIAVAMILSVLEDNSISHPPIEAVFTTDEEIGMIGAGKLDYTKLQSRKMINLDIDEPDCMVVSCAGGCDFRVHLPISRIETRGTKITVHLNGLQGGHSGVAIHMGRVNGGMLAGRVLHMLAEKADFDLISVNGGDKGNAIIPSATIELVTKDVPIFIDVLEETLCVIKKEISAREPSFAPEYVVGAEENHAVLTDSTKSEVICFLLMMPNGVLEMSKEMDGLVETSLNLGILQTSNQELLAHFTLRSNKQSALQYLEKKLSAIAKFHKWKYEIYGEYPSWDFKEASVLQKIYRETYRDQFDEEIKTIAVHAGLECGIFSKNLEDLDCIAVGPAMYDIHTVNERLSISSTGEIYALLLRILEKL